MQNTFLTNFWVAIRQWCYPREFRISLPIDNVDSVKFNDLIQSLDSMVANLASPEFQTQLKNLSAVNDEAFITDLATRLWRVRQNLEKPGSGEPFDEVQRGYRHLERLFSHLEELGIRVMDRTGEFYDAGMALKVVSSEPMDGIGRVVIKETIEPAIYRGTRLIQPSQVVIGVPLSKESETGPNRKTGLMPTKDKND